MWKNDIMHPVARNNSEDDTVEMENDTVHLLSFISIINRLAYVALLL